MLIDIIGTIQISLQDKAKIGEHLKRITNNPATALNIMFVPSNEQETQRTYISKHNLEFERSILLLMITKNNKDWHYITVIYESRLQQCSSREYYCYNYF